MPHDRPARLCRCEILYFIDLRLSEMTGHNLCAQMKAMKRTFMIHLNSMET